MVVTVTVLLVVPHSVPETVVVLGLPEIVVAAPVVGSIVAITPVLEIFQVIVPRTS